MIAPANAGPLVDVTNDMILAVAAACAAGPCPFVLVDLETGAESPWDPKAHEARLGVDQQRRTLLLHDDQGTARGERGVTVTDPDTGETRVLTILHASGMPLVLAREGQDAWVPVGWELLAQPGMNLGEKFGPTLVRLEDGEVLQLPVPDGL